MEYWCEVCSHKFNSSLPSQALRLAKSEHKKKKCLGKSSEENRQLRAKHFLMSQEQYERFKSWRTVSIPDLAFDDGSPETLPETSWRRILEAIFPGSGAKLLRKENFRAPTASTNRPVGDVSMEGGHALLLNDEDYGSMIRVKKPPDALQAVRIETSAEGSRQYTKDSPADHDEMASSPGVSSISADDFDDWDANLAEKLYNDLCLNTPAFGSIRKMNSAVLPLLHSFVLRLGLVGSSKADSEIMSFVSERKQCVHSSHMLGTQTLTDLSLEK